MAGSATDLYDAAETLLTAAATALETLAPAGGIDRQLVSQGPPVWDCCPQLSVHIGGPSVADTYPLQPPLQPMQRSVTSGFVDLVVMTITVLRCVVVLEQDQQSVILPSPQALSENASDCAGDCWAIWNFLYQQHRLGALFQDASGRREFALDPAVALNNGGGCGGYELPVRFQLPGFSAP